MAKRKRLTPARQGVTPKPPRSGAPAPFSPAPIANVAGDAATNAAAEELARTLGDARRSGRMVLELPLDAIEASYLVRDRLVMDADEMEALKASLVARGQQTPIDVADLGDGRFGLISGFRRLTALQDLAKTGGTETVLALLRRPDEASDTYLAMVEENEIRVGLSYYERARIGLKAVEQGVFPDTKKALLSLFHAASRAKRSKIRSFLNVVAALDGAVLFPGAMGERMGLTLSRALDEDAALGPRIRAALIADPAPDGEAEQARIAALLQAETAPKPATPKPGPSPETGSVSPQNGDVQGNFKPVTIRKGVEFLENADGSVLLRGAGMDGPLRARLLDWLITDATRN